MEEALRRVEICEDCSELHLMVLVLADEESLYTDYELFIIKNAVEYINKKIMASS